MRVLFLTRRFYPSIGGVEKHILGVARELIKRGHDVTVITESFNQEHSMNYHLKHQSDTQSINSKELVKSNQIDDFERSKIKILRLNFGKNDWFKKFRIWANLFKKINLITESDVVHCHDVFFWYLPFRFLFPTKKVFTTFHGYETKFPPTLKAKFTRKISEKLSFGNICVGDFIKKWYGTKPDIVTYGGVNVEKIRNSKPENRNKFKIQNLKFKILLMGRLEEDNGAKIYLEALKKLKKLNVSYKLTVLGDGKYRRHFEEYGEVKGFVPQSYKYIERSDFIFASSYLSILEGLIYGKKIFSVFPNSLKEDYLKESPFREYISISGNVNSLVDEFIRAILDNSKTYNNQLQAQKWAEKQTWKNVADSYLELWNK